MQNIQAVVLAAGKSTRFNTSRSKLNEKICGQEMILFPLKILANLKIPVTIVVGYQKEIIESTIKNNINSSVSFVEQKEQNGTGHALICTKENWNKDNILILNGDLPLIDQAMIEELYKKHITSNSVFSFVIAHNIDPRPNAYGKVIEKDTFIKIVEEKDAQEDLSNYPINAGIYIVKKDFLLESINEIKASSKTGEFYLTVLPDLASQKNKKIVTLEVPFDKVRGVNTLEELWAAEAIKKTELITDFMHHGVLFENPIYAKIDIGVKIGAGTSISQGVVLQGKTEIGSNCQIKDFSKITDSYIEDGAIINSHTIVENSIIKANAEVGPFALIHSESKIGKHSTIGHFVETKKSVIGSNSKAKHLTYIGDAEVGNHVNIGAGTITCNFNGYEKPKTIIKDHSFIGSNNSLVAPVIIGENTYTAAGSVITDNVPDNAFAIARSRQITKEEYAYKYKRLTNEDTHNEEENFIIAEESYSNLEQ